MSRYIHKGKYLRKSLSIYLSIYLPIYLSTGIDLTTRDSYFTLLVEVFTNLILVENTNFTNHLGRTEHKIMVLKPANKYKIIR